MSERDAFIEDMRAKGCGNPRGLRIRNTRHGCTPFHAEIVFSIREAIGEGDPLDLLLSDEFLRRKLNLHARAL